MSDRNASKGMGFARGLLAENPVLRLGLGLCPALAVTTTATNGLGMGIATACVLVCTSLVVSLLGFITDEKGRIAVSALVSAAFATVAQLILKGWFPGLSAALGVFVPLIAVNCLILGTSEDYAGSGKPLEAVVDAAGMGVGYILALTVLGMVRELIGHGSLFGAMILPAACEPMLMMVMPAGGFLALGLIMGIVNAVSPRGGKEESRHD